MVLASGLAARALDPPRLLAKYGHATALAAGPP